MAGGHGESLSSPGTGNLGHPRTEAQNPAHLGLPHMRQSAFAGGELGMTSFGSMQSFSASPSPVPTFPQWTSEVPQAAAASSYAVHHHHHILSDLSSGHPPPMPGPSATALRHWAATPAPLGPAATATSMQAPSEAFTNWIFALERDAEERLLQEAMRRFCAAGAQGSLLDFRVWLQAASHSSDEAVVHVMREVQLRTWLQCVRQRRRGSLMADPAFMQHQLQQYHRLLQSPQYGWQGEPPVVQCNSMQLQIEQAQANLLLPMEVKERVFAFLGGRHVWGPINAARARAVAESALRQLRRCEGVLRVSALAALVTRYVHPAVIAAAEAGQMQCYTEIPTDDVALQALFEVCATETQHPQEVGSLLAAHLALDGFEVEPKYHDPEYGLWRGFWVDKCNRLRLVLRW